MLVQKQPEGTYGSTQYGKLVLQLSSPLEFVFRHKEYFLTHDIWRLPFQFVNRIGELSQANLIMDTMESMNRSERMFTEAEQYIWGIGEGPVPELMGPIINEKIRKGIKLKMLGPEGALVAIPSPSPRNVELRGLSDIPVIIGLTEEGAAVCFRLVGGRTDYAGFSGKDPVFLNWVKDLFLY